MNTVYILFKKNDKPFDPPFIVSVYEKEEDAYERKEQMFESDKYFVEEWEVFESESYTLEDWEIE